MQSAFQFANNRRIIIYTGRDSSGEVIIRSFNCDENWKPYGDPFGECPLSWSTIPSQALYHRYLRTELHRSENFVPEHSTIYHQEPAFDMDPMGRFSGFVVDMSEARIADSRYPNFASLYAATPEWKCKDHDQKEWHCEMGKDGYEYHMKRVAELESTPADQDAPLNKPTIVERFADNGAHSHWELVNTDTGEMLWSEWPDDTICKMRFDFENEKEVIIRNPKYKK